MSQVAIISPLLTTEESPSLRQVYYFYKGVVEQVAGSGEMILDDCFLGELQLTRVRSLMPHIIHYWHGWVLSDEVRQRWNDVPNIEFRDAPFRNVIDFDHVRDWPALEQEVIESGIDEWEYDFEEWHRNQPKGRGPIPTRSYFQLFTYDVGKTILPGFNEELFARCPKARANEVLYEEELASVLDRGTIWEYPLFRCFTGLVARPDLAEDIRDLLEPGFMEIRKYEIG